VKERIVGALLLEWTGALGVLALEGLKSLTLYALFHLAASFLMATVILPFVPARYRRKKVRLILFFWSFIFFSGPAGFVGGLLTYFYLWKRKSPELPAERIIPEELPIPEPEPPEVGEAVGQRLNEKLVIYLMKFTNPVAIRFLKKALSSSDDEVRLLAFSVITSTEKEIMDRIYAFLRELERARSEEERFRLYAAVGEMYWELVFLNIADEELRDFYLKTALDYLLKALEIKEEGKTLFLTGRIYLKLGDEVRAEYYLIRSTERGFPLEKVAPYLMEVYYRRRDFEKVFLVAERVRDKVIPDMRALSILKVWA